MLLLSLKLSQHRCLMLLSCSRRAVFTQVCRHDLASACVRAAETTGLGIEYLSVIGQTPAGFPPPEETCNVAETRRVLGWEAEGNLEQWRAGSSSKL